MILKPFLALLTLLVGPLAHACSCLLITPEEALRSSALVIRGKVVWNDEKEAKSPGSRMGQRRARIKVETLYKGVAGDEVEVKYLGGDGAMCGMSLPMNEAVVLSASGSREHGFQTYACMRYAFWGAPQDMEALQAYRAQHEALAAAVRQDPSVKNLRAQAAFLQRYNDHEEAELAYSELLRIQPEDAGARLERAEVRFAARRFEAALSDFDAVIAASARHPQARRGRTLALIQLKRYDEVDAGERDFSGLVLAQPQSFPFAGRDLVGADFRGASLSHQSFADADLRGADFSHARLYQPVFARARLSGAKFEAVRESYKGDFGKADLRGASFRGARLFHTSLRGANLEQSEFGQATLERVDLEGASLRGARLAGAKFTGSSLRGVDLAGQDLLGADFSGADLRGTVLRRANLRQVKLNSYKSLVTDMRGADLSGADLSGMQWGPTLIDCRTQLPAGLDLSELPLMPLWSDCAGPRPAAGLAAGIALRDVPRLTGIESPRTDFSGLDLSRFGFHRSHFDGSDFSGATLTSADIQGGSYVGANFSRARLTQARIVRANFKGASFEGADLSGARFIELDLSEARLDGANLQGACYDDKTVWPAGLDPVARGAAREAVPSYGPCGRR